MYKIILNFTTGFYDVWFKEEYISSFGDKKTAEEFVQECECADE